MLHMLLTKRQVLLKYSSEIKFPRQFFRIKSFGHAGMIIVDRDSYDDLFRAQDNELHFMRATLEDFDFRCVFRADIFNETHTNAIRYDLNRAIPAITSYILEEVKVAMDETLGVLVCAGRTLLFDRDLQIDWTPIVAFPMLCKIISRETHRVLVGLPLCRNKDYLGCVDQHGKDVAIATQLLRLLPEAVRG